MFRLTARLSRLMRNPMQRKRWRTSPACGLGHSIFAVRHYAICVVSLVVFVELSPFRAFSDAHWSDDALRRLQAALITQPDAGHLIPGARGLRTLRWTMTGRGKRSGARVIYYWLSDDDRIYRVHAYAKNETTDLTPAQIRQLAALMIDEVER